MLPVAILAGGLATRLRPVTEKVPKSMLEVAGQPFIFHQLRLLRSHDIREVVLCLGHLGEQVEKAVGDGKAFDLSVRYSYDGPALLGTGGALKRALPFLGSQFFVLYGDSYLQCPYGEIQSTFQHSGKPALMTVMRNSNQWDKSNVLFQDHQIIEYNKRTPKSAMAHIDFGLGILSASVFEDRAADQAFDLAEIYHELSLSGQLAGFEVHQRFYEIGSHQGLKEFEDFLKLKESRP
jgi:NDP-sugar pyrophosphorylase family protein